MSKSKYNTVSGAEATKIVQNASIEPVVVAFSTNWTGNGKMLDNFYEELSLEYRDDVRFLRIDVEKSKEYADGFGIWKIPTTLIFCKKDMVDYFEGLLPKQAIKEKIDKLMEN